MKHPDSDTTATIERELHAVDAALRGGAADHDDAFVRELQELGLVLKAEAAEPDAEFAEALEERVRQGFPAKPGSTRALADEVRDGLVAARAWPRNAVRNLPSPRRMLPAAGALATVVVIGFAVSSVDFDRANQDDGGDGGGGGGGGAAQSAEPALPPAQAGRDESAGSSLKAIPRERPGGGGGFAPDLSNRKVERSISMTLEAPDEEIPALAQDVAQVTNRHGGFVLSSTLDSDEEGANGFFELRIPAGRLRAALADLAGLATVRSQSQSGQDVTRRHVTTRDRLQSARAERRSLLRRLEIAATDEEAEAIRRRLDIVAGEINGLRALLRDLRLRTDYAVVTVDLAGTEGDSGSGGAGGSFDDAVSDAGDLTVGLAGVLIRVLAIALPLALIGALGWLVTSALRRRRRESVLA
ncbi:MAG TPA: DUF4349 domain-containing protein [Thermoleophilaceae bacterium]|nr:DUF4349 domain-containing protein [Thermoleophilaceae bacterium]